MDNRYILSPFFLDEPLPELKSLATEDWVVNAPTLPGGDQQARMSVIHRALADCVAESVAGDGRPVSIAGDCCTAIGVLAGLQRAGIDPGLIWFDAHGDFNTWETTPSGFLGGMPLAMLVGRGEQTMPAAVGLETLPEANVILTDARDLDPAEHEAVSASDVVHLTDVGDLMAYPLPGGPLYVHFDVDVVTPEEAPAQNYPAPGGPSSSIVEAVLRRLAASGQVMAVSVSSWNPRLDRDGGSQRVCMSLLEILVSTNLLIPWPRVGLIRPSALVDELKDLRRSKPQIDPLDVQGRPCSRYRFNDKNLPVLAFDPHLAFLGGSI